MFRMIPLPPAQSSQIGSLLKDEKYERVLERLVLSILNKEDYIRDQIVKEFTRLQHIDACQYALILVGQASLALEKAIKEEKNVPAYQQEYNTAVSALLEAKEEAVHFDPELESLFSI